MKKYFLILAFILSFSAASFGQGNGFSFQGRLNDGTIPANGAYDLEFRLYPAIQGGTQLATTASRPNTTLINGVFSVILDFGPTAFTNPNSIYIEIAVRPNGSPNAYTILGPRQQLTVVPFSVRATNATNADNADNATNAQTAVSALTASNIGGFTPADFIRNQTTPQPNSSFTISNNGFIGGRLSLVGPTIQNRDQGGFVKAMVFVDTLPSGAGGQIAADVLTVCPASQPELADLPFKILAPGGISLTSAFRSMTDFILLPPNSLTI